MESTQIIKAEGKCNTLKIQENCKCNIENFDQGGTNKENEKKDDNICISLLKKLPISISDLRLIMWGVIGMIVMYFIYHMLYNRNK